MSGLLEHTIFVAEPASLDDAGESDGYGEPEKRRARVRQKSKLVRMPGGEETTTTHMVATDTAISRQARVWLPGEDPKDVEAARDVLAIDSDLRGTRLAQETWL